MATDANDFHIPVSSQIKYITGRDMAPKELPPDDIEQYRRRQEYEELEKAKETISIVTHGNVGGWHHEARFRVGDRVHIATGRYKGRTAVVKDYDNPLVWLLLDGTLHYAWLHQYDLDPDKGQIVPTGEALRPEDV